MNKTRVVKTMKMLLRDMRFKATDAVTNVLIKTIAMLNPYKDRSLSHRLHQLADYFDTRPTGDWD